MHKITAVVITYNEEDRIAQCINSLLPVADEIIVVDSYSTDTTAVLCKNTEVVRFIEHPFEGYGMQKNFGIEKASHDLILSLDADEVLSEQLIESILRLKEKESLLDGYFICRSNNYCGKWIKHGGWYPDKKLRLWNRNSGLWNESPVHEIVVLKKEAHTGLIKGDILHYSYESITEHITQLNKYTDLAVAQMMQRNKKGSIPEAIVRALWKFFHDYLLKLGLLDGYFGLIIAVINSFTTFLKYVKFLNMKNKGLV